MTTVFDGRSTDLLTLAAQTPRADRVDRVEYAAPLPSAPVGPKHDPGIATVPWLDPPSS